MDEIHLKILYLVEELQMVVEHVLEPMELCNIEQIPHLFLLQWVYCHDKSDIFQSSKMNISYIHYR